MISKQEVIKRYRKAAKEKEDYKKATWSSKENMLNRLKVVEKNIDFSKVKSWIDVGCGPGNLFEIALIKRKIPEVVGLDLIPEIIKSTKKKRFPQKIKFEVGDFETYKGKRKFDLITFIGALQTCGIPLEKLVKKFSSIANKDAQIVVSGKNKMWKKLTEKILVPTSNIDWVDPQEFKKIFEKNGFEVRKIIGIDVDNAAEVKTNDAHDFLLIAIKK